MVCALFHTSFALQPVRDTPDHHTNVCFPCYFLVTSCSSDVSKNCI